MWGPLGSKNSGCRQSGPPSPGALPPRSHPVLLLLWGAPPGEQGLGQHGRLALWGWVDLASSGHARLRLSASSLGTRCSPLAGGAHRGRGKPWAVLPDEGWVTGSCNTLSPLNVREQESSHLLAECDGHGASLRATR